MLIKRIEGANAELAKNQKEYKTLPVRVEQIELAGGGFVTGMTSAWELQPGELAALNAGASIHLTVLCRQHPPVMMYVGPIPQPD